MIRGAERLFEAGGAVFTDRQKAIRQTDGPFATHPVEALADRLRDSCGNAYERALDTAAETLSARYAMDFRRAAQRYAAFGVPAQVADRIRAFHAAGARHRIVDLLGRYEQRPAEIERFAAEVLPLLADLRG